MQLTPMMQQYLRIKRETPPSILMFRLGDFYEMFFDDAVTASRVLGITLTAREAGKGNKVPMCGVPYHAAQEHIARLIRAGHKVAVCDQMEDPGLAKGLVKREVTRVVTPGTAIDEGLLGERDNNYLAAIHRAGGIFGLCCLDLSTGEFLVTELEREADLMGEIGRLSPSEFLLPAELAGDQEFVARLRGISAGLVNQCDDWLFEREGADIHCRVPISMVQATLGSNIEVPTLDGKMARVNIPAGAQGGHQFRLRGKGMPIMRSTQHGDMYIEINVETPTNLTAKQKELLKEFENAGKTSPTSEGFFSKVKEMFGG